MVEYKEKWLVATAMANHGGGFVSTLGDALLRADGNNTQRIYDAFPEYWQKYLQIAKDKGYDKEDD